MHRNDFETFRIVEQKPNKTLTQSGKCALCGNSYTFGNRVIAQYNDGNGLITEPFNLCDECFQREKQSESNTRQTRL